MRKPFLKWAGSKTKLIPIIKSYSDKAEVFVEPFVGSGVVFINMDEYEKYFVYDINPDLINLYNNLKNNGRDFIDLCEKYFIVENNNSERYYELRKEFNSINDKTSIYRSALFVYLNRHCFNGLCRYNSRGEFNVPIGKYSKPYFPREEMEYFFEKSQNVEFIVADFREAFSVANKQESCFIYCDPPYVSEDLNKNEGFNTYSKEAFSVQDQIDLAILASETTHTCLVSNHSTAFTKEIYKSAKIFEFDVKRFIAAKKENRRDAKELLALFKKNYE